MRISIVHDTEYRYSEDARSVLQHLRLTPRPHDGQHVLRWRVETNVDGHLRTDQDALGNIVHVFSADRPVATVRIRAVGEVVTSDTSGIVRNTVERVPGIYFLRDTPLTAADAAIREMADGCRSPTGTVLGTLHELLAALHDAMTFETGRTEAGTSAAEAFAARRGVCQDITHIFLAAARHLDIPSRYVSGYFHRADGVVEQEAGHAWAESKVPGLGWVGFDPTNGISTTDAHVRVAVGLDYHGAAPVRGSRRGGGSEALTVQVRVGQAQRQSQS